MSKDITELVSLHSERNPSEEFKLLSNLSRDVKPEQLIERISALMESIQKGDIVKVVPKLSGEESYDETSVHYLSESDKLLVTNGSELKLLAREDR
jgi:anthranilate/para-aminobenzoate synthase component I